MGVSDKEKRFRIDERRMMPQQLRITDIAAGGKE